MKRLLFSLALLSFTVLAQDNDPSDVPFYRSIEDIYPKEFVLDAEMFFEKPHILWCKNCTVEDKAQIEAYFEKLHKNYDEAVKRKHRHGELINAK